MISIVSSCIGCNQRKWVNNDRLQRLARGRWYIFCSNMPDFVHSYRHKAGAKLEAVEYRSRAQANDELRTRLKVLDSCLTHSLDSTQSTRSNFRILHSITSSAWIRMRSVVVDPVEPFFTKHNREYRMSNSKTRKNISKEKRIGL